MPAALKAMWRRNERILSNFFSLSVLQFASYLVPVITLPYLVRVLGPSRYGLVELARAVSMYFVILTDYGFNLSATQAISVHRDDPRKVSEIFSAVMVLKLALAVFSLVILAGIVLGIPKLRMEWPVYFMAFGAVVGQCLFPIWLFQGLERMKYIAVLTVAAKLLVAVCIFLFIRHSDHYLYVPGLQSAGFLLMGLAGLVMALRDFPIRFQIPSLAVLKRELTSGWHLFLSRMATTLYTTSNTVILGLFTTNTFVAYYAAGEKIVRAIQGLQVPLSQAIFPHIGKLASESKATALAFAAKVGKLVSVVTLILSVGLFVGAPQITRIILGEQFVASVAVVRILSFLPFIVGLSNILGVQIMVNFGLKRALTRILGVAVLIDILLAFILVVPLHHIGVSIALLVAEVFVTVAMYVALRKRGIDIFSAANSTEPPHEA